MKEETRRKREIALWQAFAVGDAMGMPTEFMRPEDIEKELGGRLPEGLLPAALSYNHGNLPTGSVTDDTEQNLYLLAQARGTGALTVEGTVEALKAWIRETGAVEKQYIGPSSLKALEKIEGGMPAAQAGMGGTTCGGIMRTPAAVLWKQDQTREELADSIQRSLLPTHNSSEALEAAGAYGFALEKALEGGSLPEILAAAGQGGACLMERAPYKACAPSACARIAKAEHMASFPEKEMLRLIFELWGTGLPSADVAGAVFAIFVKAGKDVWQAIRLATVIGGDTDTIAALAGALCAAYAGGHNIPESVLQQVLAVNRPLFEAKYPEGLGL